MEGHLKGAHSQPPDAKWWFQHTVHQFFTLAWLVRDDYPRNLAAPDKWQSIAIPLLSSHGPRYGSSIPPTMVQSHTLAITHLHNLPLSLLWWSESEGGTYAHATHHHNPENYSMNCVRWKSHQGKNKRVKPVIKTDTMQLIPFFNTTFSELNHTHDKEIIIVTFTAVRTSNLRSENELPYLRNTSHVTNDTCTKKVYCNQSTHI